jgi:LPXTG-motif cell wall-anchored protein
MAFAPNGTLYAVNASSNRIGTISTSTGAFTQVDDTLLNSGGLTFDSSGTAWVLDLTVNAVLFSAEITDYAGTADLSGQLTFAGSEFFSQAIVVLQVPAAPAAPELPDTGSASVALGVTGLAAAGVIALGAVMMIVRRRAS